MKPFDFGIKIRPELILYHAITGFFKKPNFRKLSLLQFRDHCAITITASSLSLRHHHHCVITITAPSRQIQKRKLQNMNKYRFCLE